MDDDDDDDDDVEILSINGRPVEVDCEICHVSLTKESVSERQAHYEHHFDLAPNQSQVGSPDVIDLSSSTDTIRGGSPFVTTSSKQSAKKAEKVKLPPPAKQNVFWHRSQDTSPPSNFTPGIIPVLKQALLRSHAKSQTVRATLCYEGMVHVGSEGWDMGWGCGYRNFLMACTALIDQQVQPMYFPALDQPSPPGVRNLQQWIEDAWRAGFDAEGAADLKHELVGTRKWIGTAELHVAFLSRGIPSRLVDFPHVASSANAVLQWIVAYFSEASRESHEMRLRAKVKTTVDEALRGASPVVLTDRMPLVLQNKGHSRTIVGYERARDGSINLLCFDPSRRPKTPIRKAALAQFSSSQIRQDSSASTTESKRHHSISPSKIINTVLHPRTHKERDMSVDSIENNKKRRSDEDVGSSVRDLKRVRGGLRAPGGSATMGREVIEILDDDDMEDEQVPQTSKAIPKAALPEVDYSTVLDFFRLKPRKVGKNDRYQILYFPLEDLLTEQERWARRVVTSEVVQ